MDRLKELIKKAKKLVKVKGPQKMHDEEIDKGKVKAAATKMAKAVWGDKADSGKIDGTVKKAISMAKDTEDAIGIVQGFYQKK